MTFKDKIFFKDYSSTFKDKHFFQGFSRTVETLLTVHLKRTTLDKPAAALAIYLLILFIEYTS